MALRDILAKFDIKVDRTQLKQADRALNKTSKSVSGLFERLGGLRTAIGGAVAALGVARFGGFINETLKAVDSQAKLAKQIGVTTDDIQVLSQLAREAGTDVNTVGQASRFMARAADEAAGGAQQYAEAFNRLGVSVKNTDGSLKQGLELFAEVGGALGDVTNSTERLALAQQVLGGRAAKLLPAFEGGSEAFKEQIKNLKELAVVYDQDFAKDVEHANDLMSRAGLQFLRVKVLLIKALLPAITAISNTLIPAVKGFAEWIGQIDFAKVGIAGLIAFSGKLTRILSAGVGRALRMLTHGFRAFRLGLRFGGGGLRGIVTGFKAMGGALTRGSAAMRIISRVALALFRILAKFVLPLLIFDEIITTLEGGESKLKDWIDGMFGIGTTAKVVEDLKAAWQTFLDFMTPLVSNIVDSFKVGFEFLFGDGKKTTDELTAEFLRSSEAIGKFFDTLFFETLPNLFAEGWEGLKAIVSDALAAIGSAISSAFSDAAGSVGDMLSSLPGAGLVKDLFGGDPKAPSGSTNTRNTNLADNRQVSVSVQATGGPAALARVANETSTALGVQFDRDRRAVLEAVR